MTLKARREANSFRANSLTAAEEESWRDADAETLGFFPGFLRQRTARVESVVEGQEALKSDEDDDERNVDEHDAALITTVVAIAMKLH